MARTYRDIAIEDMLRTVEDAMSHVIDWWGDLPPPMKKRSSSFAPNSGRQSTPWNSSKGHSTGKPPKPTAGKALPDVCCGTRSGSSRRRKPSSKTFGIVGLISQGIPH